VIDMTLAQLAGVAGIVGFLVWLGWMLAHQSAKKPAVPDTPFVPGIPTEKRPAPPFFGFLLNAAYDEGERFAIACWPQRPIGSQDGPCAVQRGLVDNGTGPYKVRFTAYRKSDAARVPVYRGDTGPRCDGEWVDPGEIVIYANGIRPYAAIGAGYPCGFIPLSEPDAKPRDCTGTVIGLPASALTQVATDAMVIHFTAKNADDVEITPEWLQEVAIVPAACKTKK
jgi:hypothetical protein